MKDYEIIRNVIDFENNEIDFEYVVSFIATKVENENLYLINISYNEVANIVDLTFRRKNKNGI